MSLVQSLIESCDTIKMSTTANRLRKKAPSDSLFHGTKTLVGWWNSSNNCITYLQLSYKRSKDLSMIMSVFCDKLYWSKIKDCRENLRVSTVGLSDLWKHSTLAVFVTVWQTDNNGAVFLKSFPIHTDLPTWARIWKAQFPVEEKSWRSVDRRPKQNIISLSLFFQVSKQPSTHSLSTKTERNISQC